MFCHKRRRYYNSIYQMVIKNLSYVQTHSQASGLWSYNQMASFCFLLLSKASSSNPTTSSFPFLSPFLAPTLLQLSNHGVLLCHFQFLSAFLLVPIMGSCFDLDIQRHKKHICRHHQARRYRHKGYL